MGKASESELYKKMYLYLFEQVSAALGELRWGYATFAVERLKQA